MHLTIGFSPCPNDIFIFDGLLSGRLRLGDHDLRTSLHDVQTLNEMAFQQTLDVTKLSFFAWFQVRENYRLLRSGGALGYGCGPLVIAAKPLGPDDLADCRVVLPGQWTTAHLLFRLWAPRVQKRFFVSYDRIFEMLRSGEADCGVIIHESRFTFEREGFQAVVDLGAWWEKETGMPIPLGCIAVHRRIPEPLGARLEELIRESIMLAQADPAAVLPTIRNFSQETTSEVLEAHIRAFVNAFSLDLGTVGLKAVSALEERARLAGLIP